MFIVLLGDLEFFENLVVEGYDHIIDIDDGNDNNNIIQLAKNRGHDSLAQFLQTIREFEVPTRLQFRNIFVP